jgi:hypothetical protein
MSSRLKLHLGSAGYCVLLACLNWFRSVEYARQIGLKSESFAPVGLAWLLSLLVMVYLLWRGVRAALARLESGRKVREGRWIESWSVILYALPLLWHRTGTSSWIEADGALATATGGYGHALSSQVFLFAVAGLLLFQVLARLIDGRDTPPQSVPFQRA